RFTRYRTGGGVVGNVPPGALRVLKSSVPYVRSAENRVAASGGLDAQSLADATLRAPRALRTLTRAVTAEDFEALAGNVPGVARAYCIGPGSQEGTIGQPAPGEVVVVVLPQVGGGPRHIPAVQLNPAADLLGKVSEELRDRCIIGVRLKVIGPRFSW